MTQRKSNS